MLRPTSLLFLALAASIARAQTDTTKLDAYFDSFIAMKRNPSIAVAVAKDGKVIYAKAFGYADIENDVKATPETVYRLGSITKQFTATMIMQLVGEGKLKLDDTLVSLLPDMPKAWSKVTLTHLLNHTSGIRSYTEVPGVFEDKAMKPTTPAGIIKVVSGLPMEFEPGSKWNYNNTGYELLGMIIEKLDKRPYAESLKARILDPLDMQSTYFTSERTIVKHRAHGYSTDQNVVRNAMYINMDWPYAAGSMESTVLDLAKWDAALYGDKILPQSALKQMWTPTKLTDGKIEKYGFGWHMDTQNAIPIVEHSGGIPGFTSDIRRAPTKGLTVIVLTNTQGSDAGTMAKKAMELIDPSFAEAEVKAVLDNNPKATEDAQAILKSILDGTLDRTRLTPAFAKIVTPERLKDSSQQLAALGPLKNFSFQKETKKGDSTVRTYHFELGETSFNMDLVIDDNAKIAGLGIRQ